MGMWDHFYNNSALDQNISTHYVNLSNYGSFKSKFQITVDDQYDEFKWLGLYIVSNNEKHQPYKRNFANWLLDRMQDIHD